MGPHPPRCPLRGISLRLRSQLRPGPPLLWSSSGPRQTQDRLHPRLSRPDPGPIHPPRPTRIHQRLRYRHLAPHHPLFLRPSPRSARICSPALAAPTSFRINTCKSVTKQTTLTLFRINTYEKRGGWGSSKALQILSLISTASAVPSTMNLPQAQ